MGRALLISLILHAILFGLLVWSGQLDLLIFKARERNKEKAGVMQVDIKLYKATDTPMNKGEEKKDLPPPLVQPKAKPPQKEKLPKPVAKPKEPGPSASKKKLRSILDQIRQEAKKEDDRPPPKENNFPRSLQGEKDARGTGGVSKRTLSPAELALQSAMRRYFELPDAQSFRRKNPNAVGYLDLQLVGVGSQFQIVSLHTAESSGFAILDRSCELAIRKALEMESFGADVIHELNGKEATIRCEP